MIPWEIESFFFTTSGLNPPVWVLRCFVDAFRGCPPGSADDVDSVDDIDDVAFPPAYLLVRVSGSCQSALLMRRSVRSARFEFRLMAHDGSRCLM